MKPKEAFGYNIERARRLVELYKELVDNGKSPSDVDDLLRSAYVLAVGSLDAIVHDHVGEKLVPYIRRAVKKGDPGIEPIEKTLKDVPSRELLLWMTYKRPFVQVRKAIEGSLHTQSFQHPGKIDEAFGLIGKPGAIKHVAGKMGIEDKILRRQLVGAAKRRNQIVHEGDREKSKLKKYKKRPIDIVDVVEVLDLIENVGNVLAVL